MMATSLVEILHDRQADPTNLTVIFHEQDHTIGNALKHVLSKMNGVEFCGYSVPHPLEDKILVRVQTYPNYSASDILLQALVDVEKIFASIRHIFEQSIGEYRVHREGDDAFE